MSLLRRASNWAQIHPKSSRFIIAIATILSVFLHYYYGVYLFAYEITIPYSLAILGIILGVSAVLLYPIKHNKTRIFAYSYRKQKALDFFIFMLGGLLVMYLGNRRAANVYTEFESHTEINQVVSSDNADSPSSIYVPVSTGKKGQGPQKTSKSLSRSEIRKQLKSNFKELKKALRNEIKELRKQRKKGQEGDGRNALLTILTILGALALGFIVAALACSLSCNGNELLGSIVLIAGWAGILVLAFVIIRRIFGKNKGQKLSPKNDDNSYPY